MGYTTDFSGQFNLDKPLTAAQVAYLNAFSDTRRMARNARITAKYPDPLREAVGLPVGPFGGYFVAADTVPESSLKGESCGGRFAGQSRTKDILDYNRAPEGQPGLWCQWVPSEEGDTIEWNGKEKFYDYISWLAYIIENFLKPWGYTLNGEVTWAGEESDDIGMIRVQGNVISTAKGEVTYTDFTVFEG